MKNALRLNPELIREAEFAGRLNKRSTPKQIEYWAEIGKHVAQLINPNDLIAVSQGFATLRLETVSGQPLDTDDVFNAVEQMQKTGKLSQSVSNAPVRYESSSTLPGLLDRVLPDGSRESGRFQDGQFIPCSAVS